MKNNLRRVEIEWFDALLETAHLELACAKSHEPVLRRSLGFLVVRNKEKVVITLGTLEDLYKGTIACDGAFVIPKGCIKAIHILDKG